MLAARVLGVESFGLFGIVFLAYVTVLGSARALVSQPLLVHPDEARSRAGEAVGSALQVGALAAVAVLIGAAISFAYDDRLAWALVVLAVCLPLVVLQDLGRYLGFATHRPSSALVLDSAWLVLLVLGAVGLVLLDVRTLPAFVGAWAGSGALAGLLVLGQQRGQRVALGGTWMRTTWVLSWRYLVSFSVTQGAALVASVALSAISGARALAGVRGAALVLSPFTTFVIAGSASSVTDIARNPRPDDVRRRALQVTAIASVVALLNGVVFVLLPDALGRLVLGAVGDRPAAGGRGGTGRRPDRTGARAARGPAGAPSRADLAVHRPVDHPGAARGCGRGRARRRRARLLLGGRGRPRPGRRRVVGCLPAVRAVPGASRRRGGEMSKVVSYARGIARRVRYWSPLGPEIGAYHRMLRSGRLVYGPGTYGVPVILDYSHTTSRVVVGSDSSIGGALMFGGQHPTRTVTTYPFRINWAMEGAGEDGFPLPSEDTHIGSDAWIGTRSIVMSGVTIGDGAVIGAMAVVTKDVPPYAIVAGIPARVVRYRHTEEQRAALLEIRWWDWPEERIRQAVPLLSSEDVDAFIAWAREREAAGWG